MAPELSQDSLVSEVDKHAQKNVEFSGLTNSLSCPLFSNLPAYVMQSYFCLTGLCLINLLILPSKALVSKHKLSL